MNVTEKDLEDYIFANGYIKVNGKDIEILERQYKVGTYYIDMIGVDEDNNIYVFELKQNKIDGNALSQLLNYMHFIKLYRESANYPVEIYGVLIGNDLTDYMELGLNQLPNIFYLNYSISFSTYENEYQMSDYYMKNKYEEEAVNFNAYVDLRILEDIEITKFLQKKEEVNNGKETNGKSSNS